MAVGTRVKELREARGWSIGELSRITGLRKNTISDLERNVTSGVTWAALDKLAAAFDVDPGYLIVRYSATSRAPAVKKTPKKTPTKRTPGKPARKAS